MAEHLADLRVAALARDLAHQPRQRVGIADPFRRLALVEAAEIDELHVEPADRLDGLEHVGLELERKVPGGLPAHGRVHGEDQPAAARASRPERPHLLEEGVDLGAATSARRRPRFCRSSPGPWARPCLWQLREQSVLGAIDGPLSPWRQCRSGPHASSLPAASRLALPPEAVRSVERTRSTAKASR